MEIKRIEMDRRVFVHTLFAAPLALAGCTTRRSALPVATERGEAPLGISLTEWRTLLSPMAFAVLFEEATEPPFSSPLDGEYSAGTYVCAACFQPLFSSETKYDSRTGWPSFFDALPGAMGTKVDYLLGYPRVEYHCSRCGGHQGHVFDDGPRPTGKRWCNNGVALRFIPQGQDLPALRPSREG